MDKQSILQQLKDIVQSLCPNIDVSKVDENTLLKEELGIDSLAMLLIALRSEAVFNVRFDNVQGYVFTSVGDVSRFIEERMS